ncbi:MAG: hypothetical protein ABIP62_17600, partial [Vicinamibacteria bacterium]
MRFVVRPSGAGDVEPTKSEEFGDSLGDKGALVGGLELGSELSDFGLGVSLFPPISRGGFREEF